MKLSEFKNILQKNNSVQFMLADGTKIPKHFHVTEVGQVTKDFIDCGGVMRSENFVNFQLWTAKDYDHRLQAEKLLTIINLSEKKLNVSDLEIEVEYQTQTIGRYGLDFDGTYFILSPKMTNCLAPDKCGITPEKLPKNTCCGSGCC